MGLQFDLETANWMAFVIDRELPIPQLESSSQREKLLTFLDTFRERFFSSATREAELSEAAHRVRDRLIESWDDPKAIADAIEEIRFHFGNRYWTALILPSGDDPEIDEYLCSPSYLRVLLEKIGTPGLVLQLAEPPARRMALDQIFPAIQFALADSSAWPGLLVWSERAEGAFFPFGRRDRSSVEERGRWIVSRVSDRRRRQRSIQKIGDLYTTAFPDIRPKGAQLHILQISDLHLGSAEASARLPRVEQHIERLARELGCH